MWKNNIDRKIYLLIAWRVNECKNGQRKTNCVQNKENYLIDQVEKSNCIGNTHPKMCFPFKFLSRSSNFPRIKVFSKERKIINFFFQTVGTLKFSI